MSENVLLSMRFSKQDVYVLNGLKETLGRILNRMSLRSNRGKKKQFYNALKLSRQCSLDAFVPGCLPGYILGAAVNMFTRS